MADLMAADVRIGVDIGGTFTDVVVRKPGEPVRIVKLPTTRQDHSIAVIRSIEHMGREWGIGPEAVGRFLHGTTVATNALIERKGGRCGIITTLGFKDVLEIGRQMRRQMYDLNLDPEAPVFLAPGRFRKEVRERVTAESEILVPLDEADVARAADELAAAGIEAVAICFLFSFLRPEHEIRAREIVRQRHPTMMVSLSHEVDPAFREYERTAATAFDAYIKPTVDRYLANLEAGLAKAGVSAPLQVMQSRGGVAASSIARKRPVRLVLSGPAAGVIGGRMVGESAGIKDIITIDVGGTSSDIALIVDGRPGLKSEGQIEGYPVRVGMVDVNAIGAGGGSIAWIDGGGGLRVGPHSAGSDPGPACYGKGGAQATVTDASIVLGYLDPSYFAGGTVKLRPDLARDVIERTIAKPLKLDVDAAALGIHRVVNAQMAEGIRLVSIRQGIDPRKFALLPLGGAGPVHATVLARELGMRRILVPRYPGVLSAAGLLAAPIEHEVSIAFPRPLAGLAMADAKATLQQLDAKCAALMAEEKVDSKVAATIRYFADVCYIGQAYTIEVALDPRAPDPIGQLRKDFMAAHDRIYGHAADVPAKIVNLRSVHAIPGLSRLDETDYRPSGKPALKGKRTILLAEVGKVEAAIIDRAALKPGETARGPAIVEQEDSTTVIEPGWQATVDKVGNMVIDRIDA
ncbi:MAG: hydantoinase/oxoprolinase family protein [Alphaproteobacteria bacterium]|nr:hydantoinase/oxoprolinase family protein [Alphaproteobacteria bacterium]